MSHHQLVDDFVRIFNVPAPMLPYLDHVATIKETEVVVALQGQTLGVPEIAQLLHKPEEAVAVLVKQCFDRMILSRTAKEPPHTFKASGFYHRISPIAMYEQWTNVPAEVRDQVVQWELDEWIKLWTRTVAEFDTNPEAYLRMPNHDFLLLHEALEIIDAAEDHVVVVCDCRAFTEACDRGGESCIRLDAGARLTLERGVGRRLTKDECRRLVIQLDRKGLMHTGDWNWRKRGRVFGFCNCCPCDCYPFRGGTQQDMHRQWPRSHFVAERDMDKCEMCGRCMRRCHFDAFYHDGTKTEINGKRHRTVMFDPDKCWGCGLCATTCPDESITMRSLDTRKPLLEPVVAIDAETQKWELDSFYEMESRSKGGLTATPGGQEIHG